MSAFSLTSLFDERVVALLGLLVLLASIETPRRDP